MRLTVEGVHAESQSLLHLSEFSKKNINGLLVAAKTNMILVFSEL